VAFEDDLVTVAGENVERAADRKALGGVGGVVVHSDGRAGAETESVGLGGGRHADEDLVDGVVLTVAEFDQDAVGARGMYSGDMIAEPFTSSCRNASR
jgi:hypothetical protein